MKSPLRGAQLEDVWGLASSRDPADGENRLRGSVYLAPDDPDSVAMSVLKELKPRLYELLKGKGRELEERFQDAVQFRFQWNGERVVTSEEKPLERSPAASFAIAVDLVNHSRITRQQAICRVCPRDLARMLATSFDSDDERRLEQKGRLLARGQGAGGGAVSGRLAFTPERVAALQSEGQTAILAVDRLTYRERETLPMVGGVLVGHGCLSAAAQFNRPSVLLEGLRIVDGTLLLDGVSVKEGSSISLDGFTGRVYSAGLPVAHGELTDEAATLLEWADEIRTLELRANVTSSAEVARAVEWGAQGVGLCRLDYTFLSYGTLGLFQRALREICDLGLERSPTIDELTAEVAEDIRGMLREVPKGQRFPFILRLLDFPLAMLLREWEESGDLEPDYFEGRLGEWKRELNPLQGLRCGRLALVYPALLTLQLKAALSAWKKVGCEKVNLQLMLPGTSDPGELRVFRATLESVCREQACAQPKIGTMLETPRACLMADALTEIVDFCSFGTGDLTESTCGFSRYDSPLSFLPPYIERGMFAADPFVAIDPEGVGELMRIATTKVRGRKKTLELGTCGAQATERNSLKFCRDLGLAYVSAPGKELPGLRLMAAQLELEKR